MALSKAGPSSEIPGPTTPSEIYWSPETSVSKLAKGFNTSKKAKAKRHHITDDKVPFIKSSKGPCQDYPHNKRSKSDHSTGVHQKHPIPSAPEEVISKRAKKAAKRSKPDSYNESHSEDSDVPTNADEIFISDYSSEESGELAEDPDDQEDCIPIESDQSYFDPALIRHPRSGEWLPTGKVAKFISTRVFKSLDRTTRNKMKAECPRPTLPHNSSVTPELDPVLTKFLMKSGKNPKKGLDRSFRACQDKLMDLIGPLTKIVDLAEESSASNRPVDTEVLLGWAQRAVCIFGNANAALSVERKRSILMKIDPQITNLASKEPEKPTEGLLFGDDFIHDMGKYVGLFSSINKAQSFLKKVFSNRVFGRAGKGRSRFPGRSLPNRQNFRGSYHNNQTYQSSQPVPTPFFPYRRRPWRARGQRGVPRTRSSSAS
ncbi:uncharacterized protein LOC130290954 [Hyla sarda]|uniref:uncharacterized protein LOC130290954 n=1 Tax=Hyla sarda TaxID=327740 RepID=UPI0024C2CDED|nr:uncharacterized protein LOC130290954 [Hyla sarda]